MFSGRAEAETGTGAGVPTFELVPGLLVENSDTVVTRIGMGLFVDCARVSWSSNAFRTISTLTSGLVLSSANGRNLVIMLTLLKSVANLAKRLKIRSRKEYTCQRWDGILPLVAAYHASKAGFLFSRLMNLSRIWQ